MWETGPWAEKKYHILNCNDTIDENAAKIPKSMDKL
jgi:hypothetical protein